MVSSARSSIGRRIQQGCSYGMMNDDGWNSNAALINLNVVQIFSTVSVTYACGGRVSSSRSAAPVGVATCSVFGATTVCAAGELTDHRLGAARTVAFTFQFAPTATVPVPVSATCTGRLCVLLLWMRTTTVRLSSDIAALAVTVLFHRLPHTSGCIDAPWLPELTAVRRPFGCHVELTMAWT